MRSLAVHAVDEDRIRGPRADLPRRLTAEACGTAMLLVAVVGSGIMAERLSGGNVALALLANAVATGGALLALILAFGPVSGAHLNPAVTLSDASQGGLPWREVPGYLLAQCLSRCFNPRKRVSQFMRDPRSQFS